MSAPISSTVPSCEVAHDADTTARRQDLRGVKSRPGMVDRWLAARIQTIVDPAHIRVELWDGSSPYADDEPAIGDFA